MAGKCVPWKPQSALNQYGMASGGVSCWTPGMRILAACAALIAPVALLSSCSPIPPQMVGTYEAKNRDRYMREWITIDKDGAMTWSLETKATVNQFVGLISTDDKRPETAQLTFVSTSRFIGTKLSFPQDCSTLTVDWDVKLTPEYRPRTRSSHFVKKPVAP